MTRNVKHIPSCLIVGAGPAGLAPLFAAAYSGKLAELLASGVVIVERGDTVGDGELGRYAIRSDSAAEAFLDIVIRTTEPALLALQGHPLVLAIERLRGGSIPLSMASDFLRLAGQTMCALVERSPNGLVLLEHTALYARRSSNRTWMVRVRCERTGAEKELETSSLILATGADQRISRLYQELVAGTPLLPSYEGKLLQTGEVLSAAGLRRLETRLASMKDPHVVVVGGSTSAGATARTLLHGATKDVFDSGRVTLMHRRALRIFYNTASEARADGYLDFGPDDICPLSGRLYRLAGFRFETRELIMGALGVGGRTVDPRLHLHLLETSNDAETKRLLDDADLIIAGLGYRPRALPLLDVHQLPLSLLAECDDMRPMVDERCNILDSDGLPIEGVYGIGLASGFVPSGDLGGEASFRGQANSLWLWQHDLGLMIVRAVLTPTSKVQVVRGRTQEQFLGAHSEKACSLGSQPPASWLPAIAPLQR